MGQFNFMYVQAYDLHLVKALLAFGANINPKDEHNKTPLDILETSVEETSNMKHKAAIVELLKSNGAKRGEALQIISKPPPVEAFPEISGVDDVVGDIQKAASEDVIEWTAHFTRHYNELEKNIEQRLSFVQVQLEPSEAMSIAMQLKELKMYEKAGSRILFLDGGGVRGLIQIEILSQLEVATGRKITELFDWIVGTSTGGIIALAMVYGKYKETGSVLLLIAEHKVFFVWLERLLIKLSESFFCSFLRKNVFTTKVIFYKVHSCWDPNACN